MQDKTIHKQPGRTPVPDAISERPRQYVGLWYLLLAIFLLLFFAEASRAQSFRAQEQAGSPALTPVTVVVTVETKHGRELPVIYPEDVLVFQGRERLKVTQWVPLEDGAGLELMVVVDDACNISDVGLQLRELRKFIRTRPADTAIGVGYMRNSTIKILQNPTRNHDLASEALRLPIGGSAAYSSPYLAITDLIKGWPESGNRRVIFMVSPGIDGLEPGPDNMYLDHAMKHAQKARIEVSSIYCTGAVQGHWLMDFGQSNLLQLADKTGGEAYFQGSRTPLSYTPYLRQFADRLGHQYKLTFLAYAEERETTQHIRIETEVPGVELEGPEQVRIPGVGR